MNKESTTPDNEKYVLIPREYLAASQPDDEINLLDLVRIFQQHQKVFYVTFTVVFLFGIIFALIRPVTYRYQSTIELGRIENPGKAKIKLEGGMVVFDQINPGFIEDPKTVKNKIENSIIPIVQKHIMQKWGKEKIFDIEVAVPKKTNVVLLESKGKKESAKIHTEIHNEILTLLRKTQKPLFDKFRKGLSYKLETARIELQHLQDDERFKNKFLEFQNKIAAAQDEIKKSKNQIELVNLRAEGLKKLQNIKRNELQKTKAQLTEFHKIRQALISNKTGDSSQKLLTQSMITGEIQRLTKRVSDLEQYLQVTAEEQKKSLLNQKTELIRSVEQEKRELQKIQSELEEFKLSRKDQIQKKQIEIKSLQDKLHNLIETHFTSPVQQSINPVGPKRGVIIALSLVLGIMLGFLFVFMAHMRQTLKETEPGQSKPAI